MGKAEILENLGEGRYRVRLLRGDDQPAAEVTIWCADYSPDLEVGQEVGTLEINRDPYSWVDQEGNPAGVAIMPHAMPGAGLPVAARKMSAEQYFLNSALLPGMQKWRPSYRLGEILDIDAATNTATVGIEAHYSNAQGLNVNPAHDQESVEPWESQFDAPLSAFEDFKERYPSHPVCQEFSPALLDWTAENRALVEQIQRQVNNSISYAYDSSVAGKLDHWDVLTGGGQGDCEDYALTKMLLLYQAGVPGGALQMVLGLARPPGTGVDHAWLEVKTAAGTWVLDNNYRNPMRLSEIRYTNRTPVLPTGLGKSGIMLREVPIRYCLDANGEWFRHHFDGIGPEHPGLDYLSFPPGRKVVVHFKEYDWAQPEVIGFPVAPGEIFPPSFLFLACSDHTMRIYSPHGNWIWWHYYGKTKPVRVATDAAGNLFAAGEDADLRKLHPVSGLTWLHDSGSIKGLAVDAAGNSYLADGLTLKKLSPAGTELLSFRPGALERFAPTATAVASSGAVFCLSTYIETGFLAFGWTWTPYAHPLYWVIFTSFNAAGEVLSQEYLRERFEADEELPGLVHRIAATPAGDAICALEMPAWDTTYARIEKRSPGGSLWWGNDYGVGEFVPALAVDAAGNIYAIFWRRGQDGYSRLVKISPTGGTLWSVIQPTSTPALAVDAEGYIYTADHAGYLRKFTPDTGELLAGWPKEVGPGVNAMTFHTGPIAV